MPALNAQSAILDICREFSESRPNGKAVPSTPRLSFWPQLFKSWIELSTFWTTGAWTVLFRHNRRHNLVAGVPSSLAPSPPSPAFLLPFPLSVYACYAGYSNSWLAHRTMLNFGREEQHRGVEKTKPRNAVFVTFFLYFSAIFFYRPIRFTDWIKFNN